MVTFTFIRHGESTDNLRPIWAGWKDAPLSNHGMNQARALGISLANTRFTAIHSSTLKRALMTAQAVRDNQQDPQPPMITSPLLREQNYGIAQGKPFTKDREPGLSLADHFARGIFPILHDRAEKFPEGESSEDLARRAKQVIQEIVLPYVRQAARGGTNTEHVAIASHGLFINEVIAALVKMDAGGGVKDTDRYKGLLNTAWTRVTIEVKGAKEEVLEFPDNDPPPVVVHVTDFNRHEHLDNIIRQKGGIGSASHDPKQKDIRAFFGGGTAAATEE